MAAFPTVKHHTDSFSEQRGSALGRGEMEAGPPKQARVKTRVMITVTMKLAFFSKAEFTAFETFFRDTIKEGADWFDWTHPRTGTVHQARFVGGQEWAPTEYKRATLDLIDLPITLEYWSA